MKNSTTKMITGGCVSAAQVRVFEISIIELSAGSSNLPLSGCEVASRVEETASAHIKSLQRASIKAPIAVDTMRRPTYCKAPPSAKLLTH